MYIQRSIYNQVLDSLNNFPITALIGPRQCGKSTLAKKILETYPESLYLDLERPSDLIKLQSPEWFLSGNKTKLICIDEIQRMPELFPIIRSLVDEWDRPACFFILGSASRDLINQSSESLAGRIIYKRLTPFLMNELDKSNNLETYFFKGGFPRSFLQSNESLSFEWRLNFINTFLERDLLFWKGFTPGIMRKLWQMLAHLTGQQINYSRLSNSLGVSSVTVKNYIDLLVETFMLDLVPPYISNMGKRLVKSPKVYISDSGITAALLNLRNFEELSGHPAIGGIWEQIVLTNLKANFPHADIFFYRTSNGAECDFVLKVSNRIFAIECKNSYSPSLNKSNHFAIKDINPDKTYLVSPNSESWEVNENTEVTSLINLIDKIKQQTSM